MIGIPIAVTELPAASSQQAQFGHRGRPVPPTIESLHPVGDVAADEAEQHGGAGMDSAEEAVGGGAELQSDDQIQRQHGGHHLGRRHR